MPRLVTADLWLLVAAISAAIAYSTGAGLSRTLGGTRFVATSVATSATRPASFGISLRTTRCHGCLSPQ